MPLIEALLQNIQTMRSFTTGILIKSFYRKLINSTSKVKTSSESGGSTQETDSTGWKIVLGSCYICYQGVIKL